MNWKQWIIVVVLVVFIFPIIGKVVKSQNSQAGIRQTTLETPAVRTFPPEFNLVAPISLEECYQQRKSQSMRNVQLWDEYCQEAFDTTKHPIARSKAHFQLMAWRKNMGIEKANDYCHATNPLPPCPDRMIFDLDNMRCEAKCDGGGGYAPDPTGKFCYLACPNGWPVYVGVVKGCMEKSPPSR